MVSNLVLSMLSMVTLVTHPDSRAGSLNCFLIFKILSSSNLANSSACKVLLNIWNSHC